MSESTPTVICGYCGRDKPANGWCRCRESRLDRRESEECDLRLMQAAVIKKLEEKLDRDRELFELQKQALLQAVKVTVALEKFINGTRGRPARDAHENDLSSGSAG